MGRRGGFASPAGSLCAPCEQGCCDDGLTVAEAAISGADVAVLENLKTLFFESRAQQPRQPAVVQAATGERDFSNARGGAGENCGARRQKRCQACPRLHRCDEVAMVRGRIPRMPLLGPRQEAQELARISG